MKKINYLLSLLLNIALLLGSCHDENDIYKLRINNLSDKPVYVEWTTCYPDTSLATVTNPTYNPYITKVEAKTLQPSIYRNASKGLFDGKIEKLSVFIFDAAVVENTPWDTVKAKYMILQRYDLNLEELEKFNWIITYPPTEDMKDVRMFPPYKKE
jgi:hypothetical protein